VGLAGVLSLTDPPPTTDGYVPPLTAAALLCFALLVWRRTPAVAWIALIATGLVASSVPVALSRAADPEALDLATWLVVAGRSIVAALVTTAIAAQYAIRPERQATHRVTTLAMILVAWLAAACALVVILVIAGRRADPALTWVDLAVSPTALVVHIVLVLTLFGIAGDVRAAAARVDARVAADGSGRPDGAGPGRALLSRLQAVMRELVPGAAAADMAAIEAERALLAGDLHATVLPSLRRAIADIEAGGSADDLVRRLRLIDLELERLMADRWPVVLEGFGLVAAVEELAERIEADDRLRVELEIVHDDGRPPRDVERAAWRIIQLATDNAARHARATTIELSLDLGPGRARIAIADDGTGIDMAAAGGNGRAGARGLADLRRRAETVGGAVDVAGRPPSGTVVRFVWPARATDPRPGL
jgi:signal transduction histidine kinase